MTTGGEGGMVTTNNSELFEKMWAYKDHGKSRKKMEKLSSSRSFRYVHDSFGSNFRLTEMQAALGHYQLGQLKLWTRERNRNATFYNQNLGELDVVRLAIPSDKVCHGYYKYYCFIRLDQLKGQWDRDRIIEEVTSRGGQCFSGSCPELYREGAFVRAYGEHERLKNAMEIGQQSIMLNVHPGIGDDFLAHNLKILSSVLQEAAA